MRAWSTMFSASRVASRPRRSATRFSSSSILSRSVSVVAAVLARAGDNREGNRRICVSGGSARCTGSRARQAVVASADGLGRETETVRSADKSAVQTIGARENGEIIARIRNRCCYGGADWRHLGHAGARRRGRQAGRGKERKRRPDARHNGGSHWENRVKRQHGFRSTKFRLSKERYASARIAAVTARTARSAGDFPSRITVFKTAEFLIFVKSY